MGTINKQRVTLTINDKEVTITNPTKQLWPNITKSEYIQYLIKVSPLLLPFLTNRLLTVIRYPNGVTNEAFYQKNSPDYAPEYIEVKEITGKAYIICSNLETLVWLGNQGAIEFHIPFQRYDEIGPREIVIDLDPPSQKNFPLAVEAALILEETFKNLKIFSFIKTSGNKGMQIVIPIKGNWLTYDDTKIFTTFIANYLVKKEPKWFTVERLKKNRGNKLYVDFIQHAEGKTIIAPYSLRGNEEALVSTPLHWSEIHQPLSPKDFSMSTVLNRIKEQQHLILNMNEMERKNEVLKDIILKLKSNT
jgi:DNA ligase D